jgi:protein suppressor of PHYA-105 1
MTGHQRAVSYVRYVDSHSLLSASTDNSIRLWDVRGAGSAAAVEAAGNGALGRSAAAAAECAGRVCGTLPSSFEPRLSMSYGGHVNERNFVGLSASSTGFIASGSENNRVYCYHKVEGG